MGREGDGRTTAVRLDRDQRGGAGGRFDAHLSLLRKKGEVSGENFGDELLRGLALKMVGKTILVTIPVGRLLSVVFECSDPDEEARFWEAVLGYTRHHGRPEWVTIADSADQQGRLSFQRVSDHIPPTWPERERPQQAHIDLLVDDLDAADGRVIALGARPLTEDTVVHEDESFRVYADPAGHPFCLIVQRSPDR